MSASRSVHPPPFSLSSKPAPSGHSRLAYQAPRGSTLFLTSAKTGFNVEETFQYAASTRIYVQGLRCDATMMQEVIY
ncbi:hypothetical protein BJ165DRAFT_1503888 [Panaeolus papilionaceus]|nr:hypothetical protein BJ165DRAFT_1503888 [Panaeolus papilionaceus]